MNKTFIGLTIVLSLLSLPLVYSQTKPLSQVYDEDQKFLDFFKVKEDKERASIKEYEKIQLQRKTALLKEKKELQAADKKFITKVDQELKLISLGYNPLRMIEEERLRAVTLLFNNSKAKTPSQGKNKKQ